jgi:hypothetical protein
MHQRPFDPFSAFIKEHPEIVEYMTELIQKYVLDGRSTPGSASKNDPVKNWPYIISRLMNAC